MFCPNRRPGGGAFNHIAVEGSGGGTSVDGMNNISVYGTSDHSWQTPQYIEVGLHLVHLLLV